MPPKKRVSKSKVNIQRSNVQTVVVKVGDQPKKRRARRKKQTSGGGGIEMPFRQLPPVVYQIPAMVTGYSSPLFEPAKPPQSIAAREPARPTSQPIFEDIGIVGTEGRGVEILDVPSKKEQLSELTTPVPKKVKKVRNVPISPFSPLQPSAKSETFQFSDVYSESNPLLVQPFAKANILPSNEKEDFLPLTAPNYSGDAPSVPPARAPRKAPRTQQQVREDLEMEYQSLTGLPVKPIISNKELKALVYAEKKRQKTKKGISRIMGREV